MSCLKKYSVLFLFGFFFSCTKDVGRVNLGNYPDNINKIISGKCSVQGCHNTASHEAAADLDLTSWHDLFAGSNSGLSVIPFNSRFSSLCYFINTYPELGIRNEPTMPLNKPPLSFDEVKEIKDWIDAGAPDKDGRIMWADDPGLKKLYAVNQGCDVVTVFDSRSQLPIRYISVGKERSTPHQLRVSPDGKFWYLIFLNDNVMKKFRCSDDSFVGSIPLTPLAAGRGPENALDWNTFVITKDGKRAYCVSLSSNGFISTVDLEKMKLIRMEPGGYFPHGITLNGAEDKLYVASQTGNYITEFDTAFVNNTSYALDNTFPNPSAAIDPHDLILSPDEKKLLVTCQKSNDVRVFDLSQMKVTKIIPTPVFPQEIIYSRLFNAYYVSCSGDNTKANPGALTTINAGSYASVNLAVGAQPHGLAVDENKGLLYLLSRNISTTGPIPHHTSLCAGRNGFVNFIDLRTFTVTDKRFELSVDPYFIFARP